MILREKTISFTTMLANGIYNLLNLCYKECAILIHFQKCDYYSNKKLIKYPYRKTTDQCVKCMTST